MAVRTLLGDLIRNLASDSSCNFTLLEYLTGIAANCIQHFVLFQLFLLMLVIVFLS